MPIIAVPLATGCPRALSTMEPASAVLHGRLSAWRADPRFRPAPRRVRGIASRIAVLQQTKRRGVVAHFRLPPRRREPPGNTSPVTIACPPGPTVTCLGYRCGSSSIPPPFKTATGPVWCSTKIRRRFPWLELIWADGGYNAWQVDAAVAKVPRLRLAIVKRNEDVKGFVVLRNGAR